MYSTLNRPDKLKS